ncbi:hypothetical protein [Glutamicibacter soli]
MKANSPARAASPRVDATSAGFMVTRVGSGASSWEAINFRCIALTPSAKNTPRPTPTLASSAEAAWRAMASPQIRAHNTMAVAESSRLIPNSGSKPPAIFCSFQCVASSSGSRSADITDHRLIPAETRAVPATVP